MESNVPKTKTETKAKQETPRTDAKTFVENVGKTGTPRNGRRIEFHFVRRKRKSF